MIGAARAFAVDLPAGYRRVDPQRYFGRDPASFSERVTPDGTIRKAVWLGERAVELRISFAGDAAHCEIVAGFEPGAADLAAIAVTIAGHAYAVSEAPTSFDATLYGILANLLTAPVETELTRQARRHPELIAYVERMRSTLSTKLTP